MEENKDQQNQKGDNLKVLRTYTSDMAQVIRDNEISAIKIAMAEKEKKDEDLLYRKSEGTNKSKILLISVGIIFIIASILISYFLLKKKDPIETPTPFTSKIDTFISYDTSSFIDVTGIKNVNELSDLIKKENISEIKSVQALFFTRKINDSSITISSADFISLISENVPAPLVRSLYPKYLIGKYLDNNNLEKNISIFLIFKTNNYDQAYASMLSWENTMLRDLSVLFNLEIKNNNFEKKWKDIVINNKDARILYGENDEVILSYVFVNKNDFVITSDLNTMREIINKMLLKS
jgi:hypothetical protein